MTDDSKRNPTWEMESSHPELLEPLKEALREVVDPEIGLNIIELGLIRNVKVETNQALLTMILTTPFCPYGPAMLEVSRQKAEQALSRPTMIEMGMEMWEPAFMEEGAGADWGMW